MSKPRVIIIGLDGATWTLLKPWVDQGKLPTLASLMKEGRWGVLESSCPYISSTAWASFLTGKNPGQHRIVDFSLPASPGASQSGPRRSSAGAEAGLLERTPVNAQDVRGESLWRALSRAGKKVLVVNLPMTYPPEKVNGCLVAGFPVPSQASDYIYPQFWVEKFSRWGWNLADVARRSYSRAALPEYIRGFYRRINVRFAALEKLLKEYPDWDLLAVHFFETDSIQHELWNLAEFQKQGRKIGTATTQLKHLAGIFEHTDMRLGQLLQPLNSQDIVIVMSDHGMAPCYRAFFLNTWLAQHGYLRFRSHPLTWLRRILFASGLDVIFVYRLIPRHWRGLIWKKLVSRYFGPRGGGQPSRLVRVLSGGYRLAVGLVLSLDDADWQRSTAYSLGGTAIGQIYLTELGKRHQAQVEWRLRRDLAKLSLVRKVHLRDELYSGPYLHEMPDLTFGTRDDKYRVYSHRLFLSSRVVLAEDPLAGEWSTHTPEGIFVVKGEGVQAGLRSDLLLRLAKRSDLPGRAAGEIRPSDPDPTFQAAKRARIRDLFPTILHLLGVPCPNDVDGEVRTEWFENGGPFDREVQQREPTAEGQAEEHADWDAAEREEMKAQLQRMGYF